mgnify:CR=1 FL=1
MSNRYKEIEETEEDKIARANAEKARLTWDSWIVDMEEKDQPDSCELDNEDCGSCGS